MEHLERPERLEHLEPLERLHLHQNTNRHGISGYILAKRIYPKSMQGSSMSKFLKACPSLPPYQPFNCLVQPFIIQFSSEDALSTLPSTLFT